ncbi:MAG: DUF4192 domain-containing protein [Candidatus Nanopelagicales bacterium]
MSTHVSNSTGVTLHSAFQVGASVPYLLGFQPSCSAVFVFSRSVDNELVVTGRLDLPNVNDDLDVFCHGCAVTANSAVEAGANSVHIVLYRAPDSMDEESLMDAVTVVLRDSGLQIDGRGCIEQNHWTDYDCPDLSPVSISECGSETAFQWAANGISYVADRDQLAASVIGPPTTTALAVAEHIDSSARLTTRGVARTAALRRSTEDAIFGYLMQDAGVDSRDTSPRLPPTDELARWLLSLPDRRVREPLMWRLSQWTAREPQTVDRLARLVRNCPFDHVAAIASVLAAHAWQTGNGALAAIAAKYALEGDPRNVLADLVFRAVTQGVHPQVWDEMLASMTLRDLRSGTVRHP